MSGQQHGNGDSTLAGSSRRDFLKTALTLAGSLGIQGLPALDSKASAAGKFNAVPSRTILELDGVVVDTVKSAVGGFAKADVVQEKIGPAPFPKKRLANLQYTDIVIQCDPGLPAPLLNWVNSSVTMNPQRKNGAVIQADFDMKERSRLEFTNALITEVTIPACDAGPISTGVATVKEAGALTLKLTPQSTRATSGRGSTIPSAFAGTKKKTWSPAHFRLQIQGLEEACARVMKVEPLTIRQKLSERPVGEFRDYQGIPASMEFSDLVITLPESFAGPFYQWFDDFVLKGNAGDERERSGFLELLPSDMQAVLLRVNFIHLGIFSFAPVSVDSAAGRLASVKVEMYCEQMSIAPAAGPPMPASPPPPPQRPSPATLDKLPPSVGVKPLPH